MRLLPGSEDTTARPVLVLAHNAAQADDYARRQPWGRRRYYSPSPPNAIEGDATDWFVVVELWRFEDVPDSGRIRGTVGRNLNKLAPRRPAVNVAEVLEATADALSGYDGTQLAASFVRGMAHAIGSPAW